jgi:hypothetical protein
MISSSCGFAVPMTALVAVKILTLKSLGGEILVTKPARLDALDMLLYFLDIYVMRY